MRTPSIGIIGDFHANNPTHVGTNAALEHAGAAFEWLATDERQDYGRFDGLVASPGSPYRSEAGALEGIRYARERRVPLLGTCGGFQHVVLEYARNVAGIAEAAHQENDPEATVLFLTKLACSVAGKTLSVRVTPGTLAHRCYGADTAEEAYYCQFGLNPECEAVLKRAGLLVSGRDEVGEVRIVEIPGHPFYMGTLFVPQMRSVRGNTHPLIAGLVSAASGLRSKHGE